MDQGAGECLFKDPSIANIVLDVLMHFHEDRYFLTDVVIMPNHVHFLVAFKSDVAMLKQCNGWKRFIAKQVKRKLQRSGPLWQVDQFDHLIRSQSHFDFYRRYIAENPQKAKLKPNRFLYYQTRLT